MSEPPSVHDIARRLAVQEALMERQAKYETGLVRLERKMAERGIEMAKGGMDNLPWQIGLWVTAVVIPGIPIRWPA